MDGVHPLIKLAMLGVACVAFYYREQVVRWLDYNVWSDTDARCWLCRHRNRLSSRLRFFECARCGMDNALVEGKGCIPPIRIPSDAR